LNVQRYEVEQSGCAGPDPRYSDEQVLATVIAAAAGLAAAWFSAGSTGLLGHPLRRAMTLLLLGVAVLSLPPRRHIKSLWTLLLLLLVAGSSLYLVHLPMQPAGTMACALVLALLASGSDGQRRDILSASSAAATVLGLYRFAATSIPWFWLGADLVGRTLGRIAGSVAGRPLAIGATFAGLDFLVLTAALCAFYLPHTPRPRKGRAVYICAGVVLGHLLYLVLLSYAPDLSASLAPPADGDGEGRWIVRLLRQAIPWNLPLLACAIHLAVLVAVFRWSPWGSDPSPARRRSHGWIAFATLVVAAVFFPLIAALYPGPSSLDGKRIVFFEKGFLNWLKPTHGSYGRLSSGMYGMLPSFIESLGAQPLISPELADADLATADVLVVIFPDDPWQEGQLQRIRDFVRRGGSLLLLGEHTTQDAAGSNRFNELLTGTATQVAFDSATFAVGGWLQSYEAISHPMTAGIEDSQNEFGVVIGASVQARWPARPVLIGRWGWADYGDAASSRAMMGNDLYDSGERLGDLVLAAEQPFGKGRIVTFGDTSGLTNAINVSSYVFTSRLFAYLAGPGAHPAWRQLAAILLAAILIVLLCRRPSPLKTSLVAAVAAGSLVICAGMTQKGIHPLPDGRLASPNNLAYIDASHLGAFSSESWRTDGLGGLALTLMRNGFLTLSLPDLTRERLERAGLLVVIAPSRRFSREQVETVKTFVRNGGILIVTVGHDQAGPIRPLLDAFGLRIGSPEDALREPTPLGYFKSPYLESQGKRVYVRFHAAWPLASTDPNTRVIAYGPANLPVILMQRSGQGAVVLVGDTCFAMNKNLEYENGAAFEGLRENADFWRWLLSMLRDETMWVPPALQTPSTGAAAGEEVKP
jgi:hypothetical protein